jgi:hypothetical protein
MGGENGPAAAGVACLVAWLVFSGISMSGLSECNTTLCVSADRMLEYACPTNVSIIEETWYVRKRFGPKQRRDGYRVVSTYDVGRNATCERVELVTESLTTAGTVAASVAASNLTLGVAADGRCFHVAGLTAFFVFMAIMFVAAQCCCLPAMVLLCYGVIRAVVGEKSPPHDRAQLGTKATRVIQVSV